MLQRLSATSTPAQATRLQATTPRASLIVLACLVFLAVLAAVLLAASLLPAATLVGRFMSATGDARAGAVTQNLIADLPRRLRAPDGAAARTARTVRASHHLGVGGVSVAARPPTHR